MGRHMGTLPQCVCPGQLGTVKEVIHLLLSLSELGSCPPAVERAQLRQRFSYSSLPYHSGRYSTNTPPFNGKFTHLLVFSSHVPRQQGPESYLDERKGSWLQWAWTIFPIPLYSQWFWSPPPKSDLLLLLPGQESQHRVGFEIPLQGPFAQVKII